jgi:hypothetical protein
MRATIRDHLYAFKKNSNHHVYYLNLAYRDNIPGYFKKMKFDLVIFHTIFFTSRWDDQGFQRTKAKAQFIKDIEAVKIGLPQDEHYRTDYICDLVNEFDMDFIYSVSPRSEWEKFYGGKLSQSVRIREILTGYLDDRTLVTIKKLAKKKQPKDIDIGYRAWRADPSLGRHGLLKPRMAEVFQQHEANKTLNFDISTREEDTILADDWYSFLLRCKYTIGVEGGASIIDRDGSLKAQTNVYVRQNPRASFEEIEQECFPGRDGYLNYFAISPRHLEACATRTCQILIEGEYNGILTPNIHYIELKRDFSNLNDVIHILAQDELRDTIVERAYSDIVESKRYTYKSFVSEIIADSLPDNIRIEDENILQSIWSVLQVQWNWLQEKIHPIRIACIRKYRSYRKEFSSRRND